MAGLCLRAQHSPPPPVMLGLSEPLEARSTEDPLWSIQALSTSSDSHFTGGCGRPEASLCRLNHSCFKDKFSDIIFAFGCFSLNCVLHSNCNNMAYRFLTFFQYFFNHSMEFNKFIIYQHYKYNPVSMVDEFICTKYSIVRTICSISPSFAEYEYILTFIMIFSMWSIGPKI